MAIPANLYVPRGLIMIAPLTNGVPGADRALVEVWNANYSLNQEVEPVYSNQDCGPVIIYRDPVGAQPVLEAEVRDWSAKNVALAVMGPDADITSTTGQTTQPGALAAGDYMVLDHKGVSGVTVQNDSIGIVEGTDYEVFDAEGGVLKMLTPQSGAVVADYTYADYSKVDIGGLENDEYRLTLVAKNRAGNCTRQRWTLWNTSIMQSGAMDLLAPNEDLDPRPIPLRFLANYVQAKKDAGESGYGKIEI